MKLNTVITKNIDNAVSEILSASPVALPTETVYGLAADALDPDAVLKVYEIKSRPTFNPLIVHVYDIPDIEKYAVDISDDAYKLLEKFTPGPLTLILKKHWLIPDIVTSGLENVALRIPRHSMFRDVIKISGKPLAAPSANRFGRISPTSAEDVLKELDGRIRFILDGGKCTVGIESTVISLTAGDVRIFRPGFITREEIESLLSKRVKIDLESSEKPFGVSYESPGMLKSHYAPVTPLFVADDIEYFLGNVSPAFGVIDLSVYEDVKKAALNLFKMIREEDEKGKEFIVISKVTDSGIGIAVNDRIDKASSGTVSAVNGKIVFNRK